MGAARRQGRAPGGRSLAAPEALDLDAEAQVLLLEQRLEEGRVALPKGEGGGARIEGSDGLDEIGEIGADRTSPRCSRLRCLAATSVTPARRKAGPRLPSQEQPGPWKPDGRLTAALAEAAAVAGDCHRRPAPSSASAVTPLSSASLSAWRTESGGGLHFGPA